MNEDVTAAVDGLGLSNEVPSLSGGNASPDALAQLGEALASFSSRVARRERELNAMFEQIAMERTSLLDAVLARLFNGFSDVIPFDRVECAFLSDDGKHTVSYWSRTVSGAPTSPGHVTALEGSDLLHVLAAGRPRVINDLAAFASHHLHAPHERRLLDEGARAVLTCPLIADGVPLGFLFFASLRVHAFSDAHAQAFQRSAGQVSIVVQKTRAYGAVVDNNRLLVRETRQLRQEATTDALTGVMNRRALDAALASAWDRYERDGAGFGLIICDIDHFKAVNDSHGHAVGDQVLAAVARCLGRGLRGADVFGRWGGEEFLAVVDTASEATLGDVAERLRSMIAREAPCGVRVTASFGSAACRRFSTLGDLIVSADRALYTSKAEGRNRCTMANETDSASGNWDDHGADSASASIGSR